MAFSALAGSVPTQGWLLYVAALIWTVAYDTMYAMVDRDDDIKIGVKSTAVLFGRYDVTMIVALQACMLAILLGVGQMIDASWPYYVALVISALLFYRHYQFIKGRTREGCFTAFIENHQVGLVITLGLLLQYWLA